MEDWKIRLVDEYKQTKERYEKLKAYNNRAEIADRLRMAAYKSDEEARRADVGFMLRRDQQRAMGEYLHCLELRATLEGIEL